jgi:DNA-binding GntR family transcriptional regulator
MATDFEPMLLRLGAKATAKGERLYANLWTARERVLMNQSIGRSLKATRRSKSEKIGEVERVYQILRDWLVTAKLEPGQFLAEPELAARCKTSRTPVREACTRLLQDKWLSRIRRKGFLVTPISIRDIGEIYEYRKILEGFTAEKVAHSATSTQVLELENLVSLENDPQADLAEVLRASETFHLRLAELAGNQRVRDQLVLILSYVKRLDILCTQKVPGWVGHSEILRALRAHQPAEARRSMEVHIELSRDKMVSLFAEAPFRMT